MGSNIEKHSIIVEGMSCGHCKSAVEKATIALAGVAAAEVDLATKTLSVQVDTGKTTLEQIKEAVDEEGFTAILEKA